MGKTGTTQNSLGSVPGRLPQTTPEAYPPPADHSFTLQAIMEMQKTLGKLDQAVTTLTVELEKNSKTLNNVDKDVHAAKVTIKVVCGLITFIGGGIFYLFWKIWDALVPILTHLVPIVPHK